MKKITVKVCGVTLPEQAEAMGKLGIDLIGFNFVESSPRFLPPRQAGEMCAALPNSTRSVGVFQNNSPEYIRDAINRSGVQILQFHGDEDPAFCGQFDLPFIRVLSVDDESEPGEDLGLWENAEWVLFDSRVKGQRGGTGIPLDWNRLAAMQIARPWMLAGGLGPHNIQVALETCSPHAVDLNSKIESAPGIKDLRALELCMHLLGRS